MDFTNVELEKYIINNINEEDELLQEITRETHIKTMHPRMLSGHIQGKILEMISYMISPKNILEIGTFTGYSAICLAKGLPEKGKLTTIEVNDELEKFTRNFFKKYENSNKIDFVIGDALKIIPKLNIEFDLVFIDGEKSSYTKYYQACLPKLKQGGFILADNTLWSGKVLDKNIKNNDYFTKGIIEFNEFIKTDNRVDKVILPIRDGITILRKL